MDDLALARVQILADLVVASHLISLDRIPDVVAAHAARVGWPQMLIYLADPTSSYELDCLP